MDNFSGGWELRLMVETFEDGVLVVSGGMVFEDSRGRLRRRRLAGFSGDTSQVSGWLGTLFGLILERPATPRVES